jgi:Na+-driven multidrug efflux pump
VVEIESSKSGLLSYPQTFLTIAKFAIPCVFSNILFFLMQLTLLYFIGQNCGTLMAASIGMGIMLMNVLCLAFTQSFNGSLETFVTQTFSEGKYYECGLSYNKHRLILSLIFVPMVIIFYFCD